MFTRDAREPIRKGDALFAEIDNWQQDQGDGYAHQQDVLYAELHSR
jgi:hypothetical protein